MSQGFEIIYITEGDGATPAAEIQFSGQRLCVLRSKGGDQFNIEFVTDLKVGNDAPMQFSLLAFNSTVQDACRGLTFWLADLAVGGVRHVPSQPN